MFVIFLSGMFQILHTNHVKGRWNDSLYKRESIPLFKYVQPVITLSMQNKYH